MGRMRNHLLLLSALLFFSSALAQQCVFEGLREAYYPLKSFTGSPLYTTIGMPNHDWKFGAPNEFVPADNFSVRWDGEITFPSSGSFTFRTGSDDGIRVFLNGIKLCDFFDIRPYRTNLCATADFEANQKLPIVVEYFEMINSAKVSFEWQIPGSSDFVPVPSTVASYSNCVSASILANGSSIDPETGLGTLSVKLSKRPASNVTLQLSSDCYSLSKCILNFSPESWNQAQMVKVQANLPSAPECCPVNISAVEGDPSFLGRTTSVTFCRNFPRPSVAYSYGDPHLKTFDGIKYDFYDIGDFYFLRQLNSELVIQERQERCAEASCNYALAIKYKSALFYLFVTREGVPSSSVVGSLSAEGVVVTGGGDEFLLYLPNGVQISAGVGYWKERKVYYLSVSVTANSPQHREYLGLAGYFDGDSSNDWMLPDRTLTTDRLAFARSWKVPDAENLFLNANAVISPYPGSSPSVIYAPCSPIPELPDTITDDIKNDTSSPLNNEPTPGDPDYHPVTDCHNFTDPIKEQEALAACSPPFNSSAAECCSKLGVSGDGYFATCLCDYNLAGTDDFVSSSVDAFYRECQTVAAALGKSCQVCPGGCSGHGNCTAQGTCICESGYQGADCSEPWSDPPTISSVVPPAITLDCPPQTITVFGEAFYGSDLSCLFGQVQVPATKISNFQLVCPVPQGLSGDSVELFILRGTTSSQPFRLNLVEESCCSTPCLNGGICTDLADGFSCNCNATGFIGDRCDGVPQSEPTPTATPTSSCPAESENGATLPETSSGESGKYICPAGSYLQVERYCCGTEFTSKKVSCVPYSSTCPSDLSGNALWPKTYGGLPAFGICIEGYSGEVIRLCLPNGTWANPTGECTADPSSNCQGVKEDNANWSATPRGQIAAGQCLLGFQGHPTRLCSTEGLWGTIENPCTQTFTCGSTSGQEGEFPVTNAGGVATLECPEGFSGQISRPCNSDGTWGETQNTCTLNRCEEITEQNATFPAANAFERSNGTCLGVAGGRPYRFCLENGTWGEIFGSCASCPDEFYGRANWPQTPGGELALGSCQPGWTGTPFRECRLNGTWMTYLSKLCDRLYCPLVIEGINLFEEMEAGTQHYGKCLQGTGRPWRKCNIDGTHGPIQNPCQL